MGLGEPCYGLSIIDRKEEERRRGGGGPGAEVPGWVVEEV